MGNEACGESIASRSVVEADVSDRGGALNLDLFALLKFERKAPPADEGHLASDELTARDEDLFGPLGFAEVIVPRQQYTDRHLAPATIDETETLHCPLLVEIVFDFSLPKLHRHLLRSEE